MRLKLLVSLLAVAVAASAGVLLELSADQVLFQLVLLIGVLCAAMAASILTRPEPQVPLLCHPVFLFNAFNAQFYVIGALGMALWGLSPLAFFRAPETHAAIPPLIGCILMVIAFLAGQSLHLGTVLAGLLPEFTPTARKLPRRWGTWGLCLVSVAGCIAWIEYQGGLLARLGTGYGVGRSGDAMFRLAFDGLLAGTLLAAWPLLDRKRPTRAERALFYAVFAFEVPFFGIIHGARKHLVFLFFGLLAMWLLRRGVRTLPKLRIAAVMVLLLLFLAAWGSLRSKPLLAHLGQQQDIKYGSTRSMQFGYIDAVADPFGVACLVWQIFPGQEPFRHGRTVLVTALGFIPRAMWPGKPIAIGKELTRYYVGPSYAATSGFSVTPTLPGEFFINFGWPGLIGGGLLFGLVCRLAVSYAARGMVDGLQLHAARVLLPAAFVMNLGEVRSDTAQLVAANVLTMFPLLVILAFFRIEHEGGATPDAA